jgi:hypothetical protein
MLADTNISHSNLFGGSDKKMSQIILTASKYIQGVESVLVNAGLERIQEKYIKKQLNELSSSYSSDQRESIAKELAQDVLIMK